MRCLLPLFATGRRRAIVFASLLLAALLPTRASAQEVVEYYGTDALGSIRVVYTPDGNLLGCADYLPYGEEVPCEPSVQTAERFTGQARDGEAGLDYFHARMYQPRTGRFNAVDPIYAGLFDPQQWNRYSYVANRATAATDPSGMALHCITCMARMIIANGLAFSTSVTDSYLTVPMDLGALVDRPAGVNLGGSSSGSTSNNNQNQGDDTVPNSEQGDTPKGPDILVVDGVRQCGASNGVGVGVTYNAVGDFGAFGYGMSGQGGVGLGAFLDSRTGLSSGGLATWGTAMFNPNSRPVTSQTTAWGAYAGVGPSLFFTNARSPQQLGGESTTRSLNVGFLTWRTNIQLSTSSSGVWNLSVGVPIGSAGIGASYSRIETKTVTSRRGCK